MGSGGILRTALLMTALAVLLVLAGGLVGGTVGMLVALAFAAAVNLGAYWFSDRIALSMSGAREVSLSEAPSLHRQIDILALRAGLPKPRVYVIDSPTPNAFATGRDSSRAAVAVTTGIVQILDDEELSGVLAHELAHIRNRDTLISAIVATAAGAITALASMAQWALIFTGLRRTEDEEEGGIAGLVSGLLMIFLAPIAATIVQLAISRVREYGADASGSRVLGDPMPLARALEKLEAANRALPLRVNPSTAHQYIVQPFVGGSLVGLFSTHPPIEERVSRLREMALRPLGSPYGGL